MGEVIEILVVDDEPDIREVARLCLELDPDMRVQVAATARTALDLLARSHATPDIVLLDVMMAKLDGPATLRTMRADARLARIPVVFVTARTREADVANFLAQGAEAVLTKPFDPLTLASRVRAILAGSRASSRRSGGPGPLAEEG